MAQLGHLQTVQALYYYNIALVFSLFVLFVVLLVNFTEKKVVFYFSSNEFMEKVN